MTVKVSLSVQLVIFVKFYFHMNLLAAFKQLLTQSLDECRFYENNSSAMHLASRRWEDEREEREGGKYHVSFIFVLNLIGLRNT